MIQHRYRAIDFEVAATVPAPPECGGQAVLDLTAFSHEVRRKLVEEDIAMTNANATIVRQRTAEHTLGLFVSGLDLALAVGDHAYVVHLSRDEAGGLAAQLAHNAAEPAKVGVPVDRALLALKAEGNA